MNLKNNNSVIYNDGEIELSIFLEKDTIWLDTNDIANIYKSDELLKDSACSILEQVASDGKKNYYKLY